MENEIIQHSTAKGDHLSQAEPTTMAPTVGPSSQDNGSRATPGDNHGPQDMQLFSPRSRVATGKETKVGLPPRGSSRDVTGMRMRSGRIQIGTFSM